MILEQYSRFRNQFILQEIHTWFIVIAACPEFIWAINYQSLLLLYFYPKHLAVYSETLQGASRG